MKINLKQVGENVKGGAVKFLIVVALFSIFMGILWLLGGVGTVKAEVKTLQESVEMAQADYDLSQSQATDALNQYCTNWKELAQAKVALADAMKINSTINKGAIEAVDCTKQTVPTSF